MNDNSTDYKSGIELLAAFKLTTQEQKLRKAVQCLMDELERLHVEHTNQSLKNNLYNTKIYCSCADAYRIGYEVLHANPQ